MRHGEAGFSASSDSGRSLTSRGIKQSQQAAQWLKQLNYQFDLGLVSPYLRAQQTFAELTSQLVVSHVESNNILVPSGDPSKIVNLLAMLSSTGVNNVIVVSHLPLVGYLVNELCPEISHPMFTTAAIACIDLSLDIVGKLEWFHQVE
ncbi:phosphohistidine phosphatase SixA [Gilliamella sp. wkB178]|uniref:phosphohistidine phosphatase SixA n=1 Tax=Gilliamella sp. wkB178 TaxID=3120259 RepID=UPI001C400582|nr:phosphohistidine phosphatase SixA [Gilliamella apicola]